MGTTSAYFKSSGKEPVSRQLLKLFERNSAKNVPNSLITLNYHEILKPNNWIDFVWTNVLEIESFIRFLNSFLVCDAADLNAATAILWKSENKSLTLT